MYVYNHRDWTDLILGNGWQNTSEETKLQARVDCCDYVHLRGVIAGTYGNWAFDLAEAFRPTRDISLPIIVGDGVTESIGKLLLTTVGACWVSYLYPERGDNFEYVYLDGLSFPKS